MIYDINGNAIYPATKDDVFSDNSEIVFKRDATTNTAYTLIRIFQTKRDGTKQFPFVYAPNKSGDATDSTLSMNNTKHFPLAINAGVGGAGASTVVPLGVVIENGILIQQGNHPNLYQLTIDNNGALGYQNPNTDGASLIENGVVSALCGFCPLVVNYEGVASTFYDWIPHYNQTVQRQIIGQYSTGDYAIISCEGRNFDDSVGWTIPEAINVCIENGLKFAFNLDGGGSVETVLNQKQINTIYENTDGRIVATYIVFNGTDQFSA